MKEKWERGVILGLHHKGDNEIVQVKDLYEFEEAMIHGSDEFNTLVVGTGFRDSYGKMIFNGHIVEFDIFVEGTSLFAPNIISFTGLVIISHGNTFIFNASDGYVPYGDKLYNDALIGNCCLFSRVYSSLTNIKIKGVYLNSDEDMKRANKFMNTIDNINLEHLK